MSTAQPAIRIEHLSKKFARSLKHAMVYGLRDIARAALVPRHARSEGFESRLSDAAEVAPVTGGEHGVPALSGGQQDLRPTEFWALRDVSMDLKKGDSVGLIGANGAGKSTLFSVLSGIYAPTEGRVEVRGRLQALIALGAGFHPALSGRENVYINAAILGLSGKRVDALMEKIVDFAGIGAFIDSPVKNFSSGMLVRLGFSVAAHMEPDNLLIDEVLAVGDAAFQLKCARYSRDLLNSGKTLMVVSHNMLIVQMMCNRVVWMDQGQVVEEGPTQEVVHRYKQFMIERAAETAKDEGKQIEGMMAIIREVTWLDQEGRPVREPVSGEAHVLCLNIEAIRDIECARVWLTVGILGAESPILGASMYEDGHFLTLTKGSNEVRLYLADLPLRSGPLYRLSTGLRDWAGNVMLTHSFASDPFKVKASGSSCLNGPGSAPKNAGIIDTVVDVPYRWSAEQGARLGDDQALERRG